MQHLFRLILLAWLLTLCGLAVSQEADAPPADAPPADAPAAEAAANGEATEGEPAAPPPQPSKPDQWTDAHSIGRAKSFALSWPKVLGIWLLLLVWIRSVDWVNRDSQINDLGYGKWNVIVFFPVLAVLLFAVLPVLLPIPVNYFLALGLFAVVYLATFIPYVVVRNRAVEKHQRVFAVEWFR